MFILISLFMRCITTPNKRTNLAASLLAKVLKELNLLKFTHLQRTIYSCSGNQASMAVLEDSLLSDMERSMSRYNA